MMFWIIGVSDIEIEITETVLKDKYRKFILSKHLQNGPHRNRNIILEEPCGINKDLTELPPKMINIIESSNSRKSSPINKYNSIRLFR